MGTESQNRFRYADLIKTHIASRRARFAGVRGRLLSGRVTGKQINRALIAKPGSRREKLVSVYEALLLDPWRELIVDAPMGTEFYGACRRVTLDIDERRRKIQLKYTQAVLGTKEVSEVFMLAVDGLTHDLPATKVLRGRLEVLIDRFVRDVDPGRVATLRILACWSANLR